jgi:hypothetical protein|tara:strand:- start:317 stop:499 length:183 start_codon:yes stop_codon:yes gene_type:complete
MITPDQLDKLENKYNKDKYVYDLWFEKVKEWAYGVDNSERRNVSIDSGDKKNNGNNHITK